MSKSSLEYSELHGLLLTIVHAKHSNAEQSVIDWLEARIKYLSDK